MQPLVSCRSIVSNSLAAIQPLSRHHIPEFGATKTRYHDNKGYNCVFARIGAGICVSNLEDINFESAQKHQDIGTASRRFNFYVFTTPNCPTSMSLHKRFFSRGKGEVASEIDPALAETHFRSEPEVISKVNSDPEKPTPVIATNTSQSNSSSQADFADDDPSLRDIPWHVRRGVSFVDDPTEPTLTFRYFVLTLLFILPGAFLSQMSRRPHCHDNRKNSNAKRITQAPSEQLTHHTLFSSFKSPRTMLESGWKKFSQPSISAFLSPPTVSISTLDHGAPKNMFWLQFLQHLVFSSSGFVVTY